MRDNYEAVLEQARQQFAEKNTLEMARSSGAALSIYPPLSWREFVLPYLGRIYRILWPTGEVLSYNTNQAAPTATALILLHYLTGAPGKPPQGKWLPFNRLWGGSSYSAAFSKRALNPLAEFFGPRPGLFKQLLLEKLNARPGKEANTYLVMALPRLPLLLRLEPGDQEVPASASILFDAVANEYLVTEDLAALGESAAARLLRWGRELASDKN
ncbi:MAG TPA: DUF3786 domain-containing protein [Bacillota bacterium]|nr:DUF3786 domain-containing protein [Bacillota bacterium]